MCEYEMCDIMKCVLWYVCIMECVNILMYEMCVIMKCVNILIYEMCDIMKCEVTDLTYH